jgi:transposase
MEHPYPGDFLNLPPLVVLGVAEAEGAYEVSATLPPSPPPACPTCGGITVGNGTRLIRHHDLPMHGRTVVILTKRRRFLCRSCGARPAEPLPAVLHPVRRMTERLAARIAELAPSRTFTSIAADFGLEEDTVRRVWEERKPVRSGRTTAPRRIGMDETKLSGGLRGVIVDLEARRLVELLPDRKNRTFEEAFSRMDGLDDVEAVCMDMCSAYRGLARRLMPAATIVADRWHVQKGANLALEAVRKSVRAELSASERKLLMHERFVLLARKSRLDEKRLLRLDEWTTRFPALGRAHLAKEAFFDLWELGSADEARDGFAAWKTELPSDLKTPFAPLLTSCRRWDAEIFAWFDCRISNGGTEGMNNLVKAINRSGFGYSFDTLRDKVLALRGTPSPTSPSREGWANSPSITR